MQRKWMTYLSLFVMLIPTLLNPISVLADDTVLPKKEIISEKNEEEKAIQEEIHNKNKATQELNQKKLERDLVPNKASRILQNDIQPRAPSLRGAQDVSQNITSLTVSPTQINDGGKTTLRLAFDEHAYKIQSGDTMTIKWPISGTAYGNGFVKQIDLIIEGVHVGTLNIDTEKAVIVFNDNINELEEVSGWAEFEISGRNVSQSTEESQEQFAVTGGNQQATLTVTKSAAGTSSVFYYKTGDMQPSDTKHIRWFLNINNEKSYVTDRIYIADDIQSGQRLDLDSFSISVDGYYQHQFYGKSALADFSNQFPGAAISADVATGKISVVIPETYASLNHFSVMYTTTIENEDQEQFENHTKAWYQEHGKPAVVGESFDYVVDNVAARGGATGKNKTSVSVVKKWEDNSNQDGKRPESIDVKLYADDKALKEPVTLSKENDWTYTWDKLPKLAKGKAIKYTVKEMTEVPGYTTEVTETSPGNVVITNKHVTEKTNITGQKTWKDNHNEDNLRPETITVNLLANGKVIASQIVSEKDNWQYQFTDLPVYEDGETITYTVKEDQVPGYTTHIKGYDILNTYTPKKTSLTVTKAWEDNSNQDGKRPESIDVKLYADDKALKEPVTLSKENNWTYTWDKLPKLAKGKAIKYTVKEMTEVPEYTTEVTETSPGNVVITNKHVTKTTQVTGQKTWKDNHDQDGKRPETITVNLLANGKVIASQTVSEKDNWQYQFTDLPVFEDGEIITYTVTEDQVPGYTTQIKGYDILNTYTPKKTSLTVTKAWEDNNNQDGLRPDSIDVQLYQDEEAYGKPVTLSKENNWTYTWDKLPKLAKGKAVKYTVKEMTEVPGHATKVTETSPGNVVITNKHVTEKTNITGQKTWKDNQNEDNLRPETITVNLLANGKVTDSQTVSEKDNWQYQFTDLPVYEDGKAITYTVTEDQVPEYTTQIKGYDILNTYTPKKTSLTVTKAWEDKNNQDGKRPESIDVQLYQDEETFGKPMTLSKENNWTYTWDKLPKLVKGKAVKYTVKEMTEVPGYTTEVTETSPGNVVITNKHIVKTTQVTGQKTWKDNHDQDGKRPETITVNLLVNGKVIASQTVSEKDNWQYQFTDLPVYEDGKAITYTVTENQVPGYTTQIKGYDILNTYTPKKTSLTVTKAWEDNNNQDGLRPDSIDVQLYQNEEVFGDPVTLSKENNWTYTWDKLPKLVKGKVVKYTVKEVTEVPGYTTEVTETSPGNVVITNTHLVLEPLPGSVESPKPSDPTPPTLPEKPVVKPNEPTISLEPKGEISVAPSQPTPKPVKPVVNVTPDLKQPLTPKQKMLPQTGEKETNWLILLGLLLIGLTLFTRRNKKTNP